MPLYLYWTVTVKSHLIFHFFPFFCFLLFLTSNVEHHLFAQEMAGSSCPLLSKLSELLFVQQRALLLYSFNSHKNK